MRIADRCLEISGKKIGAGFPTYFIADIAANHDGDLNRAIDLICMAAEAGADAAKFQHFQAVTIVSDAGFKELAGSLRSHQSTWKKSVFDVYKDASLSLEWTESLKEACDKARITFFTSPYDLDLVDYIDSFVPAFKVGSGDITWHEIIRKIALKNKPYIIATGASNMLEVQSAVDVGLAHNTQIALLQCNTNYTADLENFRNIQLNVLKSYRSMYPTMVLGLSDHTLGHSTVLGAVSLGASIIEKHFTDDTSRVGPDHRFSMNPREWAQMVRATRELEAALGCGVKKVEENEKETVILQRRALYLRRDITVGSILRREDFAVLRPCPDDGIPPSSLDKVIGKKINENLKAGDRLKWKSII